MIGETVRLADLNAVRTETETNGGEERDISFGGHPRKNQTDARDAPVQSIATGYFVL